MQRYGVMHPVAVDSEMQIWSQYAVRSWPTLVIVRPDGTLAAVAPGEPDPSVLEAFVSDQLSQARADGTLSQAPLRLTRAERREERTLFPGPQPGLLAVPTPADPPHTLHGRQARVSGLSAEPIFFEQFEPTLPDPLLRRIAAGLPRYGFVTWVNLSGKQLSAGGVSALVRRVLEASDLQPARLGLEVTETAIQFTITAQITSAMRALWSSTMGPPRCWSRPPLTSSEAYADTRAKPEWRTIDLLVIPGVSAFQAAAAWAGALLGHAAPAVVEAVAAAAARGTSYGAPTAGEVEMAEAITEAYPSIEMVRLVSSGTEAAMSVVRLARAATRRDRILKFAGGYHGHVDALLADSGSGFSTLGSPATPTRKASSAA